MSDTATITPEERAKLIAHVNSGYMTISGEGLKRALAALEQAEVNVARLTKEFNWMAHVCSTQLSNGEAQAGDVEKWKEAARRAVDAGEE